MAASSGEAERPGDGMRRLLDAPKIALDKAPVLQAVFDRLATECADLMREFSSASCTFMLNGISTGNTWDLLEAYETGIGGIFLATEWDARIVLGCDRRFVFSIVEAMYGADGTEAPFESDRPFSALEVRVIKEVLAAAARVLERQLAGVCPTSLMLERTETTLDFSTIGLSDAPALMAQLISQVMDGGGRLFVLIPNAALAPFRKRLERDRPSEPARVDPTWSRHIQAELGRAEVQISAVLDGPSLTLARLGRLRPGQILVLDATPDSAIALEAEGQVLFKAKVGQSRGAFTVSIERRIDEREELLSDILGGAEPG